MTLHLTGCTKLTAQKEAVREHWGLPTLADISKLVGLSQSRICQISRELGLPPRKLGPQGPTGPHAPRYVANVRRRLELGQTITEVAKHYGVTSQAISSLAAYHGFPIRQMRQRQR